jgi:hypothetical protein
MTYMDLRIVLRINIIIGRAKKICPKHWQLCTPLGEIRFAPHRIPEYALLRLEINMSFLLSSGALEELCRTYFKYPLAPPHSKLSFPSARVTKLEP